MRRSEDLIRGLLLKLEALPLRPGAVVTITPDDEALAVEGFNEEEIDYHLGQIQMSGFVDNGGARPMIGIGFRCLTPAGHDFLDSVRNPETWTKTKALARKAGGFSLSILADAAKALAKTELQKLGLHL